MHRVIGTEWMDMAVETPSFIYGTAWKEHRTAGLVEQAIKAGFRAIDTANQRRHYFEAGVGEGLAAVYRGGVVRREARVLPTKFTYRGGQGYRLPYDPSADLATQAPQSIAIPLHNAGTHYAASYVL